MLDRCPGCAKEVSDTADVCPGCGFKFVADAGPANTHGDADNDPVLDPPASLNEDPVLDPPASQEFSNDDLMAIQTGSALPKTYTEDSYEAPKRPAPPSKSNATVFVVAGLCIGAMALSSVFIKHQKEQKAQMEEAARVAAEADAAKARMEAERLAAEKAAELAKEAEEERIAKAAAEIEAEERREKRRRRRKSRRGLDGGSRRTGLPGDSSIIVSAVDSGLGSQGSDLGGSFDIPTTADDTPEYGKDFRVKGTVYDLFTMQPVGEADIVFSDLKTGQQLKTVTDDSGVFRAHLPINGKGYSLKIRKSGYEPKYLEDSSPSFKTMSDGQRKSQAAEWLRATAGQSSFNAMRKSLIKRDFALVPR
jgi:hypothetical protein